MTGQETSAKSGEKNVGYPILFEVNVTELFFVGPEKKKSPKERLCPPRCYDPNNVRCVPKDAFVLLGRAPG